MAFRTNPGGAGSLYIVVDVNGPKKGYSKLGQDTCLFTYGYGEMSCGNKKVENPRLVPGKLGFWVCSDFIGSGRNAKNINGGGCNNTAGGDGNGMLHGIGRYPSLGAGSLRT